MYLVVGGYDTPSTEILVSGESYWKTVGSYPINVYGLRVTNFNNMLLSFGNVTLDLLILSFYNSNYIIYRRMGTY